MVTKVGGSVSPDKIQDNTKTNKLVINSSTSQLEFTTNDTLQGILDSSGNFILGTASGASGIEVVRSSASTDFGLKLTNNSNGDIKLTMETAANTFSLGIDNSDNDYLKLSTSSTDVATGTLWTIKNDGSLGLGLTPTSKLHVDGSTANTISSVTSATTLDSTHSIVHADSTGGAFTIALPVASTCSGRVYTITKIDASANAITIDPASTETIQGDLTRVLNDQYDRLSIRSDGTGWSVEVINLLTPVNNEDSVSKSYVDSVTAGQNELSELTDVTFTSLTTGQMMFKSAGDWNNTTNLFWNNSTSKLGINDSDPGANLHVQGPSSAITDYSLLAVQDNSDCGMSFGFDSTNDYSWIQSRCVGSTSKPLVINNNLTIGITGSSVESSSQILTIDGNSGAPGFAFTNATDTGMSLDVDNLVFSTGGERLRIDENGNIGVANGNPTFKMDIFHAGANIARIRGNENTSALALLELTHNRGTANATDNDFAYLNFIGDSDTTVSSIVSQVGVKSLDVTHATRTSAFSFGLMTNGSIIEEFNISSSGIDFKTNKGINLSNPTNPQDAMTLAYSDANYLNLTGGTLTGTLTLNADPTTNLHAATKQYVDALASGLDPKESVRAATTANLSGYSPTGGTSGTGGFTNIDTTTLDGHTMAGSDRVLVLNQTDPKQNGIYVITTVNATTGAMERATDHDGTPSNEVSGGNTTFVENGTTYGGRTYALQGDGTLALNTDNLVWNLLSNAQDWTWGTGLTATGNTVDLTANLTDLQDVSTSSLATGQMLYKSAGDWANTSNLYWTGSSFGIGTSTPSALVDISDGITVRHRIVPGSSTVTHSTRNFSNTGYQSAIYDATQHIFQNAGVETMRMDSSNNFLIGTTTNTSGYRLNVTDDDGTGSIFDFTSTASSFVINSPSASKINLSSGSGDSLSISTNGSEALNITTSGELVVLGQGTAAAPILRLGNEGDTGFYYRSADDIGISTAGSEKVTIDTGGLVLRNGSQLTLENGSASAPSIRFANSATTGTFRAGADIYGIATAGTERLRVDADGLKFNGDTAAANALDDYEEGTWTPTFAGSTSNPTVTYSLQTGRYTKIGRLVTVTFVVIASGTPSGGSGNLRISGLPFNLVNTANTTWHGSLGITNNVSVTSGSQLLISGTVNSNVIDVLELTGATTSTANLAVSAIHNSSVRIDGTLTYYAS